MLAADGPAMANDRVPRIAAPTITFDIDWAPDWTVELCANICSQAGVAATFFVTHDSPILEHLRGLKFVELGVHPNFLPNSTQGKNASEVLRNCVDWVPEARSMRSHSLVQSTPLLTQVVEETLIQTDVSLFLPFHPNLSATHLYLSELPKKLVRLPYYWEDDYYAGVPERSWDRPISNETGLMIYNFHPIHVALNMATMSSYYELRDSLGGKSLQHATRREVENLENSEQGTRTFLERLLQHAPPEQYRKISSVPDLLDDA